MLTMIWLRNVKVAKIPFKIASLLNCLSRVDAEALDSMFPSSLILKLEFSNEARREYPQQQEVKLFVPHYPKHVICFLTFLLAAQERKNSDESGIIKICSKKNPPPPLPKFVGGEQLYSKNIGRQKWLSHTDLKWLLLSKEGLYVALRGEESHLHLPFTGIFTKLCSTGPWG